MKKTISILVILFTFTSVINVFAYDEYNEKEHKKTCLEYYNNFDKKIFKGCEKFFKPKQPIPTQTPIQIIKKEVGGMVYIQGGTFNMGSNSYPDEKPIHKVTLSSFYIGKYEVSQKEYKDLMGSNSNPSYFKGGTLPVEQVSWFDAIKYCNAKSKNEGFSVAYKENTGELLDIYGNITTDITKVKGYRLPTEAEWEFAARGGNKSKGYKYSGSNNENEVGWFSSNSSSKTHEIGTKKANEQGIYDMSGNVWEWCTDWYNDSYYNNSNLTNPVNTAKGSSRLIRGGSWYDNAVNLRVANRSNDTPSYTFYNIGFRLSRTP